MAMQLLTHSKKKANGKTYPYYSIAQPYWEDKKNKKKILFYLGSLTPTQAQQIRNILKVTQSEDTFTATFEDLLFENHYRYLDIAFLNYLWGNINSRHRKTPYFLSMLGPRKLLISRGMV